MTTEIIFPYQDELRTLCQKRKAHVYIVGGFLRDIRLHKKGYDVDFAVAKDALTLAKAFARIIKGAFVVLDDQHGSARVVVHVQTHIWTYDFTDFRAPTIEKDLLLRDFTVNTFCVSLVTLTDVSLPQAVSDLKSKKIRMVSTRAFSDDPLRLMRAFSLSAQIGFRIDAHTLKVIKAQAPLIINAAIERTREEFFKILHSPRAHGTLLALEKAHILVRVLPQVEVMFHVTQGGYHHLDVWRHSLMVLAQLEKLLMEAKQDQKIAHYLQEDIGGAHTREALLKLAALLHDIGKPKTRKQEVGRMTFHGHEHEGAAITRLVAKHLKLSVKERYWLEDVVRWHLRPGYLSNFKIPSSKAVFRYMRDTKQEAVAVALFAIADQRSTCGPLTTKSKTRHHENICRMVIAEYFKEQLKPVRPRLLTGNDLIKKLKLKPSPLFAEILTKIEEGQALGQITTKEQAMLHAKKLIKK
jgi:poly(A) polymerase